MNRRTFVMLLALLLGGPRPDGAAATAPGARAGKAAKGGIKIVLMPSETNPLCALRVFFRVGSVDDPKGKEGLAALTAAMLGKGGTRARGYAEVLDALYPLAAQIGFYGDKESLVFLGTVHRDNLEAYADLLAQQILEPRFADDDFQRNRQDALDYLTKTLRGNDDEALGKQALGTVLWKQHPYGFPTRGTVEGLKAITLDDVKAFYAEHFTRDRLIVGVGGGFPGDFAAAFAARFEALPAKGKPLPRLPAPAARKGAEILMVAKDAPATAISIGQPLRITRADPDFYPLTVARSYLGEHRTFNGVLMNHMRGLRGLNYGDYAYVESFIQEGGSTFPLPNIPRRQQLFEIWIRPVQPQNALFALRQAMYETEKLWKQGIPEKGMEETKQFLINYARLWTQDASRRLGYAIDAEVYGKDLVAELEERLPKIKKADVDRAVRKHLTPKAWAAAIVTAKAEEVKKKLLSGEPTPIVYDTKGTAPEILEEDKTIEKFPLPVSEKAITIVPVEKMFETR
jgi:zinc protease